MYIRMDCECAHDSKCVEGDHIVCLALQEQQGYTV